MTPTPLPRAKGRPSAATLRAVKVYRRMLTATTERRERHWSILLRYLLETLTPAEQAHYYAAIIAVREELDGDG